MIKPPPSTFSVIDFKDVGSGLRPDSTRTYRVRSGIDPGRVLEYQESVLGTDASDHVLVGEDRGQGGVLGTSPAIKAKRPSIWRWAAIKAAAHVLVHLVYPRPRTPHFDKNLDHDGRGVAGGLKAGKHRHLIDCGRVEILDDGHVITLRISRSS